MKKIFITLIAVIFLSVYTQAAYSIPAVVTTDLNVRQFPNKDAKIIDILPQGTTVNAQDSGNVNWNKINFGDYVGYVYNAYLAPQDDPIPLNARKDSNMISSSPQVIEGKPLTTKKEQTLTKIISIDDFQKAGTLNWNGYIWTYYLMSQFPGSTSTPCPGRYVNSEGFVCDPEGYVILASADLASYTMVETPFGYMGKVYDTGCSSGYLDIYTDW